VARCAQCTQELTRLRTQRAALAALAPIEPDEENWQRLRRALVARRSRRRWFVPAMSLAAAAALTAVLVVPFHAQHGAGPGANDATARLIAQSQALEGMLRLVNAPHGADPRAAVTIKAAEDRIARIDEALSHANAAGADPRLARDLWSQRVRLMAGLVQVSSAPARRTVYEY